MSSRVSMLVLVMILISAWNHPAVVSATPLPTPPGQPFDGPGGSSARFPGVEMALHGTGVTAYWLLAPTDDDGDAVLGEHLPLVIFMHGFSAIDPVSYDDWIDHIVQRGAIMVYPVYQSNDQFAAGTDQYLPNTRTAIQAAVKELTAESPDALDLSRVALAGHSVGGLLAVQYALTARDEHLPVPTALMTLMPGGCGECGSVAAVLQLPSDLSGDLDPDTRALLFNAAVDDVVGDGASRRIWRTLEQLPENQRDRVVLTSDDHGSPTLVAEHNTPETIAPGQPDAFDYLGIWKLFDGLVSCSFTGQDCDSALGGADEQTSLGTWSDGVPVTPLTVSDGF